MNLNWGGKRDAELQFEFECKVEGLEWFDCLGKNCYLNLFEFQSLSIHIGLKVLKNKKALKFGGCACAADGDGC